MSLRSLRAASLRILSGQRIGLRAAAPSGVLSDGVGCPRTKDLNKRSGCYGRRVRDVPTGQHRIDRCPKLLGCHSTLCPICSCESFHTWVFRALLTRYGQNYMPRICPSWINAARCTGLISRTVHLGMRIIRTLEFFQNLSAPSARCCECEGLLNPIDGAPKSFQCRCGRASRGWTSAGMSLSPVRRLVSEPPRALRPDRGYLSNDSNLHLDHRLRCC